MTDKEQVLQEHLEDLQIERDALLASVRRYKVALEEMTVDRDKWKHEHKLLAIQNGYSKKKYDDHTKYYKLDDPRNIHERKAD